MSRKTNYTITEGTKDDPKRLIVKVSSHNGKYGRASLPFCLVGKMVAVIVLDAPIESEVKTEPPKEVQTQAEPVQEEKKDEVKPPVAITEMVKELS